MDVPLNFVVPDCEPWPDSTFCHPSSPAVCGCPQWSCAPRVRLSEAFAAACAHLVCARLSPRSAPCSTCSAHPRQLGFFVVLCLITLNIVFGIIIDTFAELREQREHLLKLLSSRCLICGMDASDFDHVYPYPCRCLCSS